MAKIARSAAQGSVCFKVFLLVTSAYGQSSVTITAPQISPEIAEEHLISKADPVYPPIAKAAHVSGNVVLQYEINPQGHVGTVKIISGPPMLRAAAIDAALRQYVSDVEAGTFPADHESYHLPREVRETAGVS